MSAMVEGSDSSSSRAGMTTDSRLSGRLVGIGRAVLEITTLQSGADTSNHSGCARACVAISSRIAAVDEAARHFQSRAALLESSTIHGMSNARGAASAPTV